MSQVKGYAVKITGIGGYVPKKIVANEDLSKIVDTNDEWITSRTGIKERRIVSGNEGTNFLALEASKDALAYSGLSAEDLDLIIVATSLPDNLYPSTACEIQGELGAKKAVAFNVVAACSGLVFGMSVANAYLTNGTYKKALVVGVDVHSRFVDWSDRGTCILFGDGAGAMVLEQTDGENEIYCIDIHSDGSKACELVIPLTGKNSPLVEENEQKPQQVYMNGKEIYRFSVKVVPNAILNALKQANISIEELDYLIPHQANLRIIEAIAERLKLREDQIIASVQKYGNTSAASVPLALTDALNQNKVKIPSRICMVGFGSGLTWGVAVVKFTAQDHRKK